MFARVGENESSRQRKLFNLTSHMVRRFGGRAGEHSWNSTEVFKGSSVVYLNKSSLALNISSSCDEH